MKIVLWMAMSLNGMIARDNNEEDFISHDSWREWLKWIGESGCLIWGRKTYEVVRTWPKEFIEDVKGIRKIVVTQDPKYKVEAGFTIADSPKAAIERLSKESFKSAVVTGGSVLNSSFAKAGLIDEVVLNVEPAVIGKGIPVFSSQFFDLKLKFIKMVKISDDLIQLQYKVQK